MASRDRPVLALAIVRVASRLVPRSHRARWRLEWEGELWGRWDERASGDGWRARMHLDLARRALGCVTDAIHLRDGRWTMEGLFEETKAAAKSLARRPGFSAVVVGTLAVGIGGTTAIFSLARDVLLRPFPYEDPDRVVAVDEFHAELSVGTNTTYPNIHDLSDGTTTFEHIGALRIWAPALEDDRGSVVLRGATVTSNFFEILGVRPAAGRFFRLEEQGADRPNLAVISHPLWRSHFAGDPSVVGSEIRLSGEPYQVIGVTPEDFEDPGLMTEVGEEPQIWRTVASPPSEWPRSGRSWRGIGRIAEGVGIEAARADAEAVFARLAEAYPDHNALRTVRIVPLRERVAGDSRGVLLTLLASVGVLLLIACANLANLMLGRALDRRGEVALRRALGAPGWRIVHRGLAEVGILAALGGLAGLVLAGWLGTLVPGLESILPRRATGRIDGSVLLFGLVATTGAALVVGLVPAYAMSREAQMRPGRDESRGASLGRSGQRTRRLLVVGQVALTTALLIGSGLFARSLQRMGAVELGVRTENTVGIYLHGSAWSEMSQEEGLAQWNAVLSAVRSLGEVEAAGAIDYLPLGGNYSCDGFQRTDLPEAAPGEGRCAETRTILPGTLEALGVELVRGRMIDDRDGFGAVRSMLVEESAARAFWAQDDPLGARVRVHGETFEVVGIVRDMRHFGPTGPQRPLVYMAAPQEPWNGAARGLNLVVRGVDPGAAVPPVRAALAEVNPRIALGEVLPLDELLSRNLSAPRFRTFLMASFAGTGLLLAILGIAGVMAYSVARRTRELGVRLALGADPGEVRSLVLGEGGRMIVAGVALGLVAAVAAAGTLEALLFEVSARDPLVYALVTLVLSGAATAACWVPARRASRVDPIAALGAD